MWPEGAIGSSWRSGGPEPAPRCRLAGIEDPSVAARMGSVFSRCGATTLSVLTIDDTLPLHAAPANGRDAEPVTGSCELD